MKHCILKLTEFERMFLGVCALLVLFVTVEGRPIKGADFSSDWFLLDAAQPQSGARTIYHGLGEIPIMVHVQVKVPDGENEGFIFNGQGVVPRDDDLNVPYGAVSYLYDKQKVIVSTMTASNNYHGYSVYTCNNTKFRGPNSQMSSKGLVRIWAWKKSSFPPPDFTVSGIPITAGCFKGKDCLIERQHDLKQYPSLAIVRSTLQDDANPLDSFISDAIGSGSTSTFKVNEHRGAVLYGFDDKMFRIWVDSVSPKPFIFSAEDGTGLPKFSAKSGLLEILAWSLESLEPDMKQFFQLGVYPVEVFEEEKEIIVKSANGDFLIQMWAVVESGINNQLRIPASGSLSYETSPTLTPCSWGGLVFGYSNTTVRLWKAIGNGGSIICIPIVFAGGLNTQSSNHASALAYIWIPVESNLNTNCTKDADCIDDHAECSNNTCSCTSGYYQVYKSCEKDLTCSDKISGVPELSRRARNYLAITTENQEVRLIDDKRLKHSWYSATINKRHFLIPDNRTIPETNSCGSTGQVYIRGTHPKVDDLDETPIIIEGCSLECEHEVDILIRKCQNGDIQYNLKPIESQNAIAFCFGNNVLSTNSVMTTTTTNDIYPPELAGISEFDPPPDVSLFGHLTLNVHLSHNVSPFKVGEYSYDPYLVFTCDNSTVVDQNMFVTTYWYVDAKLLLSYGPTTKIKSLDEETMQRHGIGMGIYVQCGVRLSSSLTGLLSEEKLSEEKFYGIKVLTPIITVNKGSNGTLVIQPTAPIGCRYSSNYIGDCYHASRMVYPVVDGCELNNVLGVSATSRCGINVKALKHEEGYNATETFEMTVTTKDTDYADSNYFKVQLKLEPYKHKIWNNYRLEDAVVHVIYGDDYKFKKCHSYVDPHMRTVDGYPYEHQVQGNFILYRNTKYTIEVQQRTTPCNNNRAFCACAISVRAGGDVFLINLCGGLKYIGFTSCNEDGILDVRKRDPLRYKVITPIGTYIDIKIRPHPGYHNLMNVDIDMAAKDINATEGLCGYFDNEKSNDLKGRSGNVYALKNGRRNVHRAFDEEWRVKSTDTNYLTLTPGNVPLWQEEGMAMFCFCNDAVQKTRPTDYVPVANCSASLYKDCPKDRYTITENLCERHLGRHRRSIRRHVMQKELRRRDLLSLKEITPDTFLRKKRVDKEISEDEALEICRQSIHNSFAVKDFLHRLKGVDIEQAIYDCAFDVSEGNDDSWADTYVDSLVNVVDVYNEKDPKYVKNNPEEFHAFVQQSCLRNCSQRGNCSETGFCICFDGFHGPDCSIDESEMLTINDIEGGGICDLSESNCDCFNVQTIDLLETFTCSIVETQIFQNSSTTFDTIVANGEYADMFNGDCCVPIGRKRRSLFEKDSPFGIIYSVSISNNGKNFGNTRLMFVYDSRCHSLSENSIVINNGSCFIENTCVHAKGQQDGNHCNICIPEIDPFHWINNCVLADEYSPTELSRNILIAVGAVSAMLMTIILVVIVWCCKKVSSKRAEQRRVADIYNIFDNLQKREMVKKYRRPNINFSSSTQ